MIIEPIRFSKAMAHHDEQVGGRESWGRVRGLGSK